MYSKGVNPGRGRKLKGGFSEAEKQLWPKANQSMSTRRGQHPHCDTDANRMDLSKQKGARRSRRFNDHILTGFKRYTRYLLATLSKIAQPDLSSGIGKKALHDTHRVLFC